MNQAWTKEFSDAHLILACEAWDLACEPLPCLVREGESFVFQAHPKHTPNSAVALRITHPGHRTLDALAVELDWMDLVSRNGVRTPDVLLSRTGSRVQAIEADGHTWNACAFSWVPGESIYAERPLWTPQTFERWGWQLGRMQKLALEFGQGVVRPAWDDQDYLVLGPDFEKRLPQFRDASHRVLKAVSTIPRTQESFGLCHRDLHEGNILCTTEAVTCIDFDDMCWHYFAADLAIPLHGSLLLEADNLEEKAARFAKPFFRGFKAESPLPSQALDHIPAFCDLRDLEMVSVMDLWGEPKDSRWYAVPARNIQQGSPLTGLPWRKWFEDA